jgi:uncharacterized protein (TIGR03083 family)
VGPGRSIASVTDRPGDPVAILDAECERVAEVARSLDDEAYALPTRCPPWTVKVLLAHMYRDVDRVLAYRDEPTAAEPDTTAVTYWRSYDPIEEGPVITARSVETAERFATGPELARGFDAHRRDVVAAARAMPPDRLFGAYGLTLRFDEYLRTRVLEVAVHGLDLAHALGRRPWITDEGTAVVRDILVGLLGTEPPGAVGWDDHTFIETGTGRRPLSDRDRAALGDLAERFPLLG